MYLLSDFYYAIYSSRGSYLRAIVAKELRRPEEFVTLLTVGVG